MCLARAVLTGYALVPVVMSAFAQGNRGGRGANPEYPNGMAGFNPIAYQKAVAKASPPQKKAYQPSQGSRASEPPVVKSTGQPGKLPGQPDILKRLQQIKHLREVAEKKERVAQQANPAAKPTFAQRMEDLREKIKAQEAARQTASKAKPPTNAQPPKPVPKPQPKPVAQPQPKSVGKLAMSERDLDESHKDFKYAAECIKLIQTNPSKMGTAQWTDYLETLNVIERDLPRLKALYAKHYSAAEQREGGKAKKIADDWLSKLQAQKALMMAISRPGINLPSKSPLMAVARALYQKGISARDAIWEYTNYSPVAEKVMSKDTDFKLRLKALERLCKGEDYMKELRKWR